MGSPSLISILILTMCSSNDDDDGVVVVTNDGVAAFLAQDAKAVECLNRGGDNENDDTDAAN
jgi:hypothetical protein